MRAQRWGAACAALPKSRGAALRSINSRKPRLTWENRGAACSAACCGLAQRSTAPLLRGQVAQPGGKKEEKR